MSVISKPWPTQLVWVEMSIATLPLAIVASAIPTFVLRMVAVTFHWFNAIAAVTAGAMTGVAIYLYFFSSENMSGRPTAAVVYELLAFITLGVIAGLIWFWIESVGTTKE
ncbi:hypothetical protein SAMN05444358_1011058 [Ruegeria halocynthiae]|uniref:Uncharacterized protein n=1 Tax=Ruegeria halocynthiae TaxID=985054 RepID=A0A1H2U7R9_9RHOB|nr:hypothetical protein [Ruegeria halocynthiae]SDW52215.1 hypothetical protein SAMN05444358_1011058 [Ruegeria halocynthiae]